MSKKRCFQEKAKHHKKCNYCCSEEDNGTLCKKCAIFSIALIELDSSKNVGYARVASVPGSATNLRVFGKLLVENFNTPVLDGTLVVKFCESAKFQHLRPGTKIGQAKVHCPIGSNRNKIENITLKKQLEKRILKWNQESDARPMDFRPRTSKSTLDFIKKENNVKEEGERCYQGVRNTVENNSRLAILEEPGQIQKVYEVKLLDAFKHLNWRFLGICPESLPEGRVEIVNNNISKFDPEGYVIKRNGSKGSLVLFTHTLANSSDIEIGKLPTIIPVENSQNAFTGNLASDFVEQCPVRSIREAADLYCEQSLVDQHQNCKHCTELHLPLHWLTNSSGVSSLNLPDIDYNSTCQCTWYNIRLTDKQKLYSRKMSGYILLLAEVLNLPKDAKSVRIYLHTLLKSSGHKGSDVMWIQNSAYVGLGLQSDVEQELKNFLSGNIGQCQIRCLPEKEKTDTLVVEVLALKNELAMISGTE